MHRDYLKISLIILLISFTLSCSKNENIESNGYVNKNNIIYNLNYGYIDKSNSSDYNSFLIYLSDKPIEFNNGNRLVENNREVLIDLSFIAPASKNYEGYYPLVIEDGTLDLDNENFYLTGTAATFGITPNTTDENIEWDFEERNFIWKNGSATITEVNGKLNINFSLENKQYLLEGEFNNNLIDVSSN